MLLLSTNFPHFNSHPLQDSSKVIKHREGLNAQQLSQGSKNVNNWTVLPSASITSSIPTCWQSSIFTTLFTAILGISLRCRISPTPRSFRSDCVLFMCVRKEEERSDGNHAFCQGDKSCRRYLMQVRGIIFRTNSAEVLLAAGAESLRVARRETIAEGPDITPVAFESNRLPVSAPFFRARYPDLGHPHPPPGKVLSPALPLVPNGPGSLRSISPSIDSLFLSRHPPDRWCTLFHRNRSQCLALLLSAPVQLLFRSVPGLFVPRWRAAVSFTQLRGWTGKYVIAWSAAFAPRCE